MTLLEDHQDSKRRQRQRKHRRVIIFSHLLTFARREIMRAMDIDHIRINPHWPLSNCTEMYEYPKQTRRHFSRGGEGSRVTCD